MSLYTTGELAKKCNVSVRTIQYYDERGILVPTDLTEGGRRLFSDKDIATLEAFFGNHTSKTRKLTCPTCKRKIWSLEIYRKEGNA